MDKRRLLHVTEKTQTRVLYVQYNNPGAYPPTQNSTSILRHAGCAILVLGVRNASTDALEFAPMVGVCVRLMRCCAPGLLQKLHYFRFCVWVLYVRRQWQPNWIYSSDPLSCPLIRILLSLRRCRILYHEHDSPSDADTLKRSLFARVIHAARQQVAECADVCILPNKDRLRTFQATTKRSKPIFCVWNCPLRVEASLPPAPRDGRRLILFYHGSIVPARLPLSLVAAVALLKDAVQFKIVGYETIGNLGYVQRLKDEASELNVADKIEFHSAMPRERSMHITRTCTVGISLMPAKPTDINERHMVGASNKPFDYMACGLALLVSDLPDWNEMYVANGFAKSCNPDDPESIASALEWFCNNRSETTVMGEKGRQKILSDWNYENQFHPVEKILMARSNSA